MLDNKFVQKLKGKTLFITGATGLIGRCLIKMLLEDASCEIKMIALVRDIEKATSMFAPYIQDERLILIHGDVCDSLTIDYEIDYIIHAASQTSSMAFVNQPVETSLSILRGTTNILELAREKSVKGFVYLSTMEVYGAPHNDEKIPEDYPSNLDTMNVRSCYPESKRMCENLCTSYSSEYGIPAMVVRLTQTFGQGVQYDDGRVFAEFARCVIENRNIVLHSNGETCRSYLYTEDAVEAILTVLLYGRAGEAYNAANEDTYCSIYDMAQLVAHLMPEKNISVIVEDQGNLEKFGYAPTLHMNLDVKKIKNLGWNAKVTLAEMFRRMIHDMSNNKE